MEALPQVVDRLHDVKGVSGLSPYEILFGRKRPLGNLPYEPLKECEDSQTFFHRMQEIDQKVAKVLNDLHAQQSERANLARRDQVPFAAGDVVWYEGHQKQGISWTYGGLVLVQWWPGKGKIVTKSKLSPASPEKHQDLSYICM